MKKNTHFHKRWIEDKHNITTLLENGLGVTIRLNYDKNNYEEITNLIKFLRYTLSLDFSIWVFVRI